MALSVYFLFMSLTVLGGDILNTYLGHTYINKENPIQTAGIVTAPRDNVIVIGLNTNTLHILDNNGQLLIFYNTMDVGITSPFSLAFLQKELLLIGCSNQVHSTAKDAKLNEVNISGF